MRVAGRTGMLRDGRSVGARADCAWHGSVRGLDAERDVTAGHMQDSQGKILALA